LVCPRYNLYGGNDDTSQLGTQEIELGGVLRRIREITYWQYQSRSYVEK